MSDPATWVIVIGAVLALAVVGWFLTTRKTPQDQPGRTPIVDRPAGPDAESQRVDERGTLETGPARPTEPPPTR